MTNVDFYLTMNLSRAKRELFHVLSYFILLLLSTTDALGSSGYFNGTSSVSLSSTWRITQNTALSFRTCSGGELLYQRGANNDSLTLLVHNSSVVFQWNIKGTNSSIIIGNNLASSDWLFAQFTFIFGVLRLNISRSSTLLFSSIIATSSFHSYILEADLAGETPLYVGRNFRGCIYEGPNVILSSNNSVIEETSVEWDSCPLQADCAKDFDDCWSSPCQNNGLCIDGFQKYTCECPPLFNGTNCQNDYSDLGCAGQPCRNGATCHSVTAEARSYRCTCVAGYTGTNCETDINECNSSPCANGKCEDTVDGYTCMCNGTGYAGLTCSSDINECDVPQQCGIGSCFNSPGAYSCNCPAGYNGLHCEEINECDSNPCWNQGTCRDYVDSYMCECVTGYSGVNCELQDNNCVGIVCPGNSSMCVNQINSYVCVCQRGFVGNPPNCVDYDECQSNPCVNDGTCQNLLDKYGCACASGFTGTNCETNINDCQPDPCQNGGSCTDGVDAYTCDCAIGFIDKTCSTNIDDCIPGICQNDGNCTDLVNGYHCTCNVGWTGSQCADDINDCLPEPCKNGGTCHDYHAYFNCTCVNGFEGLTCDVNINDCLQHDCQNGGQCIDGIASYTCNCTNDRMGKTCNDVYDACISQPCQNGATCSTVTPSHVYSCSCAVGFTGPQCEVNIDDCVGVTCPPNQVCHDGINNSTCACPSGYTGPVCDENIDECDSSPCQNHASCMDGVANYTCMCMQFIIDMRHLGNQNRTYLTGFEGVNCELDINECLYEPSICLHNGMCSNLHGSHTCDQCARENNIYYAGQNCELPVSYCTSGIVNPPYCHNGGTCQATISSKHCECVAGWTGPRCMVNIDDCALEAEPCLHGGSCHDLLNNYTCSCIPGITGQRCEVDIDDCVDHPCLNYGICIDQINSYVCNCSDTGYNGSTCDVNIDDCVSKPCTNGGNCSDLVKDFNCTCYDGYAGKICDVDIDECLTQPCQYNGTCLQRSNMTLYGMQYPGFTNFSYATAAGYVCECILGITGGDCEINIDDCIPSPCGHGNCSDGINDFTCECSPGYKGRRCLEEINECLPKPCQNNGHCTDLVANYDCTCGSVASVQYGGRNCSVELTGCQGNLCQNNATCIPILVSELPPVHDYTCECRHGFTGQHCRNVTTSSFNEMSYQYTDAVTNATGLNISLRFRTTLAHGILFASQHLFLEISDGILHLGYKNASVALGTMLVNSGEWQQVEVTFVDDMTLTWKLTPCVINACSDSVPLSDPLTNIGRLYFGGTEGQYLKPTKSKRGYVGCMQDIQIDGIYLLPNQPTTSTNVIGCARSQQCYADTCNQHGRCNDLWISHTCSCHRPYHGSACSQEFTSATFGYNNENSWAKYSIPSNVQNELASNLEISAFFRTRDSNGVIFYVGTNTSSTSSPTSIKLELIDGKVVVRHSLCRASTSISSSQTYNDGKLHFLTARVNAINITLIIDSVKTSGSRAFANGCQFVADVLYMGGLPDPVGKRRKRAIPLPTTFQGIIQDLRLANTFVVIPPNTATNLSGTTLETTKMFGVLAGIQSSDVCNLTNPCQNATSCENVVFNDYFCNCSAGYRGKDCGQLDFCMTATCPSSSTCNDLEDGYECISVATFDGVNASIVYKPEIQNATIRNSFDLKFRTRQNNSVIFYAGDPTNYLQLALVDGTLQLTVNPFTNSINGAQSYTTTQMVNDGNWTTVRVATKNGDTNNLVWSVLDEMQTVLFINFTSFTQQESTIIIGNAPTEMKYFDGCLEDARLGDILLPFFNDGTFENNNASNKFVVSNQLLQLPIDCNGRPVCETNSCVQGDCRDIWNAYECDCYIGFDGTFCENNIDDCPNNQCVNGACVDGIANYTCTCTPGYTGRWCQIEIDECEPLPCQNNATCTDMLNDYACNCTSNYTGKNCSTLVTQGCTDFPCKNDAACTEYNITIEGGQLVPRFNCSCMPGYEGDTCDTEINYCQTSPCQNNATCTSNITMLSYTCNCVPGYTGSDCQTDINECEGEPCKNNGVCSDLLDQFSCNCTAGWEGTSCTVDINECQALPSPCVHGTCNNNDGSFSCDCIGSGYQGLYCSQDVDECAIDICKNDATCKNSDGSYNCTCTLGYVGTNCNIANCSMDICENNGTCQESPSGDKWKCSCLDYYEGNRCEDIGRCVDLPCVNNADCTQTIANNTYHCNCVPGWMGQNCSQDVDECLEPDKCKNGGNCTNSAGSYSCSCAPGFNGSSCEHNINECLGAECLNKGICIDGINKFMCDCAGTGFEGKLCGTDVDECKGPAACMNSGQCVNSIGSFSCNCSFMFVGDVCHSANPCLDCQAGTCVNICKNNGTCTSIPNDTEQTAALDCQCVNGARGMYCEDPIKKPITDDFNYWLVVGPVIGVVALGIMAGFIVFLVFARKGRATQGTYSPSRQELSGSRVELGLKLPPEERLI